MPKVAAQNSSSLFLLPNKPIIVLTVIGQLRKKIEPERALPRYILTVPGVGYRLSAIAPYEPTE